MRKSYTWVIDTGHAWLRVPSHDVESLGVRPGVYSYYDSEYTFLEKTIDAALFLKAYAARYYMRPKLSKNIVTYPAYIRSLASFSGQKQLDLFGDYNGNS
jgi:hypothetical protein